MKFLAACTFLFSSLALSMPSATYAGDTFRFRLPTDPATLDWTLAATSFETYILMNIMEGLVEIDRHLNAVPALADSWEVSKDGLVYTFHLRPGVKWSDGVMLTSKDFITSWKRLLAPGTKNEYASFLFDVDHAEDFHRGKLKDFTRVGVTATDSEHVQIRLRRVVPYFMTLLSFWVTFPQREDLVKKKGWNLPPRLVTLGPYKVTSWTVGKEIAFERNALYYGTAPSVAHVKAIIEPDAEKARKLFAENKIDVLLDVTNDDLVDYSPETGKVLRQFDYISSVFVAFNTLASPFQKSDVRRAIAQGLDRNGIPAALKGGQIPAESLIPKGIAGYESMSMPISIEGARLALQSSGYKSASEVPPITILCLANKHRAAAEYIRATMRTALDLNLEIKAVQPAEYARLRRNGKYQMVISQWGADYPDASSFMELFLSDSDANYTHWKNPRYDRLVNSAGGSLKVMERLKTYADAQKILLQDDAIIIPLYYPKITALLGPGVSELEINPLNYMFFKRIILK